MDNRERIMQCAEDLFYSRGYDAAGVQEIVDRAGITKPTLYYYFGSKRGLLQTLLDTKFARLDERMRTLAEQPGGIREKLHALAEVYYRFFREEKKFHVLMMALFYSARENEAYQTVRPYLLNFYQTVVQVFENCGGELGNMRGRQEQFAISFIGVVNQYLMIHVRPEGGDAPEAADPVLLEGEPERIAGNGGSGFPEKDGERGRREEAPGAQTGDFGRADESRGQAEQIHALVDQFMYGIFS